MKLGKQLDIDILANVLKLGKQLDIDILANVLVSSLNYHSSILLLVP
jgi:hypothetical protein